MPGQTEYAKEKHGEVMRICGFTTSRGTRCENPVQPKHHRCALHAGYEESGKANITTARTSKYLPPRIRDRYEEALADEDYLSLRAQIALSEARLSFLKERLGTSESRLARGHIGEQLGEVQESLRDAVNTEDVAPHTGEALIDRIQELLAYLNETQREDEVWDEIDAATERQRKLKETEVKRMVAANQVLTIQESYLLIRRLAALVDEFVEDPDQRLRAARELHALLNRRSASVVVIESQQKSPVLPASDEPTMDEENDEE